MSRPMRWLRVILALPLVVLAGAAAADEYSDGWGPVVGEKVPLLEARDQAGQPRTLTDLSGDKGLLLFLNRSADW